MTTAATPRFTVAELFCGCGGFSHGFWRTGRFQVAFCPNVKKHTLCLIEPDHSQGGWELL